jgi:hypothetical protein
MEDISNTVKPYKVYTALLTQSGGDDQQPLSSGAVTKGVTYRIDGGSNGDFSNVGAPSNDDSTSFVAINDEVPNDYGTCVLLYNAGAPVVTVLENTIGDIWWAYVNDGIYTVNSNSMFTLNKTHAIVPSILVIDDIARIIRFDFTGVTSYMSLLTNDFSDPGGGVNIGFINTSIEIRVYN